MKRKHDRKISNFLINPSFQMRFSLNYIMVFLVSMLTVNGYLFYQMKKFIVQFSAQYPIQSDLHLQLEGIVASLVLITFITLGIATAGIFLLSIGLSHKIAGPAYVIKSTIEKLINEDYNIRPNLREGDEFNEVYHSISKLADKLKAGKS